MFASLQLEIISPFNYLSFICFFLVQLEKANLIIFQPALSTNRSATERQSRDIDPNLSKVYYIPTFYQQQQSEIEESQLNRAGNHIYVNHNKLSVLCVAQTNTENIIWRKYDCPDELNKQEGEIIASGAQVIDANSYAVHLTSRYGHTVSELVLQRPLSVENDGLYVCEGWIPSEDYSYSPPVVSKDMFLIGGDAFISNCYSQQTSPVYKPHYSIETYTG